jgi:hypothetical protein
MAVVSGGARYLFEGRSEWIQSVRGAGRFEQKPTPIAQLGSVTLKVNQIGSANGPAINDVDLRVSKKFSLMRAQHLEFDADLFNLFNSSAATAIGR